MGSEHAAVAPGWADPAGVTAVAERTRRVEVVPVDLEEVAPAPPVPVLLKRDLLRVGGEGEFAVIEGVRGEVVVELELGQTVCPRDPVVRFRILPRVGECADAAVTVRGFRTVFKRDLVERDRERCEVGFPGDERAPRREAHPAGEAGIGEGELRRRELAVELHVAEVGESAERLLAGAPAETVIHRVVPSPFAGEVGEQVAVEDAGRFDPAVLFGADGEMGTAVAETFPGVVEDLPVDEPAVAGQPDASGADSADGERDFAQSFTSQFHGKKILSWLKSSVTDSIIPGNGRKRNGKTGRKDMILCR